MKRFLVGMGWFVVIYFGLCTIAGFIVGAIAGAANPQNGAQAGYEAGYTFGVKYGWLLFLVSLVTAIGGTVTEKLPFTQKTNSPNENAQEG